MNGLIKAYYIWFFAVGFTALLSIIGFVVGIFILCATLYSHYSDMGNGKAAKAQLKQTDCVVSVYFPTGEKTNEC